MAIAMANRKLVGFKILLSTFRKTYRSVLCALPVLENHIVYLKQLISICFLYHENTISQISDNLAKHLALLQ